MRTQNSLFKKVIRLLVGTALVFNYSLSAVAPVLAQEATDQQASPTPTVESQVSDSATNLPTDTNVSTDQTVNQDTVSQNAPDGVPAPDGNVSTGDSQPQETVGGETKTEPTLTADLSSTDNSPPAENLLPSVAQPSASLSTDKGDYSPTEKVTIAGTNLLPIAQYNLEITAQDLSFSTQVLTDSSGSFTYEYQLDGTFRPEYKVEIKDVDGTVIATITFIDSRNVTSATLNGSSQVTVSPSTSVSAAVTVNHTGSDNNWQSTGWRIGNSGNYTCVDHSNHNSDGTQTETFNITAPANVGTYDVQFKAYNNNDCSGGASGNFTLTSGIIVQLSSVTNPTLSQACGLDIALVIDNSNSIDGTELSQMKTALTGFVNALSGTPTQFSVTKFGTNASVVRNFAGSNTANVISAINGISTGGGGTDWQQAISTARGTFDPRADKPNLMIFASDGNPTFPNCGGAVSCQADVDAAVTQANTTKNYPIRILALGVGSDVNVTNLKAISGPNQGSSMTSDVVLVSDFSSLNSQFATFASQSCGGHISFNKYVDGVQKSDGKTWTFKVDGTTTITTDSNGQAVTGTLSVANHSVSETNIPSGYSFNHAQCLKDGNSVGDVDSANNGIKNIPITSTGVFVCNFYNTKNPTTGTITVHKVFDGEGPGTYANSCFTLNPNPSGFGQICANPDGYAVFLNVPAGSYSVDETKTDANYSQESNNCNGLTIVNNGDSKSCAVTNKHDTGDLIVKKVVNDGSSLTQWSFSLDGDSAVHVNASGVVDFGQVLTNDTHYVTESGPSGYHFVSFTGTNCSVQPTNGGYSAIVTKGGTTTCTFTNARDTGTVIVHKFEDGNVNGTYGPSESQLSGWNVTLGQFTQVTDETGQTTFTNLPSGVYGVTEPVIPEGWQQSNIYCDNEEFSVDSSNQHNVNVGSGETVNCYVGNYQLVSGFEISKSNNVVNVQSRGAVVTYTITVKNPNGGKVYNVKVHDVPPAGFAYISGSWKAVSDKRPGLLVPEPGYGLEGIWDLGDMEGFEIVTLTYDAKIGDSVDPKVNYDLAYATGTQKSDPESTEIYATAVAPGVVSTNFVGTSVEVGLGQSFGGNYTGEQRTQVLGASTETGSNLLYFVFGLLAMFIAGVLMIIYPVKLKKFKLLVRSLVVVFAFSLLAGIATSASAAGETQVELSTLPNSTNNTDIKLSYTVLDLKNAQTTVRVFYKRPNDSGFSDLGQSFTEKSGQISVQSIITSDDGTYQFYVTAVGTSSDTSTTVSTKLDRTSPDAPGDYKKERVAAGTYKISWKTPNDSSINRVVIWKSENANFDANDSTKVADVASSANIEQSYFDNVDPSKDYFYVLKCVDEAGNSSNFVGDSVQVTETIGVSSSTTGATGTSTGQGSQASQGHGTGGQILSAATESATPSASANNQNQESQTSSSQGSKWYIALAALAGIAIVALIWKFVLRKK